jgi:hypothetical protein
MRAQRVRHALELAPLHRLAVKAQNAANPAHV